LPPPGPSGTMQDMSSPTPLGDDAAVASQPIARRLPAGWKHHIRRGRRGDPCVYCGETPERGAGTMDHVFAQNLHTVIPDNVLTVPACRPCNERKFLGDHVLHNYVTFHQDRHRTADLIGHVEKIGRATRRGQSPLGEVAHRAFTIRKQVDPLRLGGPLPVDMGANAEPLLETLAMMVRGLYFANHGQILPPSCSTEAELLTREEGESWVRLLAQSPELWLGEQGDGDCAWMMFTSPTDPHSVYCPMCIDGVYFVGASGEFLDDDDEDPTEPVPPVASLIRTSRR
jgi:hypothetical protein